MYPDYVVERANFVVDEDQIDKILPKDYNNSYISVLILSLASAAFFGLSIMLNNKIVIEMEKKGHPSPLLFFFLQLLISIFLSLIVYYAQKKTTNGRLNRCIGNPLKWAFLIYIIINILWSAVLFHSKISVGLSGFMAVVMATAALWVTICAFNYDKWTILPSLIFLAWNGYLLYYTYDASINAYRN